MNFSNFEMRMFARAAQVAKTSTYEKHCLGCVITYKKKVIGEASNSNKTCPQQKKYNKYRNFYKNPKGKPVNHLGHAEILALKSIPYPLHETLDWSKVKVFVFRIAPGLPLEQGIARPCAACRKALLDMGIHDIYYSTDEGFAKEYLVG